MKNKNAFQWNVNHPLTAWTDWNTDRWTDGKTETQTDTKLWQRHYLPAYTGGNNSYLKLNLKWTGTVEEM